MASEVRVDGDVAVFGSGGITGSHETANTGAPVIVIGRKGSFGTVYWSDVPAFVIDTAFFVDSRETDVHMRWLFYVLQALDLGELSNDVGVPGLARGAAYGRLVRLTDLDEQRRIADFLDDRVARVDQIIEDRDGQARLLHEALASSVDELVTHSDWQSAGRLGRHITGIEQGWSPQCDAVPAEPDSWGVLKVSAVRQGHFVEGENKALPRDLAPRLDALVRPGDLLVTRANTPLLVGAFAVVPSSVRGQLLFSDKIMKLSLAPGVDTRFIELIGQTRRVRDRLSAAGTGTSQSMVNIRGDDIRNLPFPVIPEARQAALVQQHARFRDQVAQGRSMLTRQVALLNEYKQSLITAAVTGELDVTTASTKIPGE